MFFSQWLQQRPVILVAFHTLNNVPDFLPYYSVTELLCTSSLLLNEFLKNHHTPLDDLKNFLRKESNSPCLRGYFLHLFDGIDNFHFFKINF
jgi:hypothetical protein